MKKLLLIILCLCFTYHHLSATASVKSDIKRVTLFSDGAEIHRIASEVIVDSGQTELVLKGISIKIDPNSLRVSILGGAKVLSYTVREGKEDLPHIAKMKEGLESVNDAINHLTSYRHGYERERAILEKNNVILKGQLSVSLFQLKRTATFYRERFKAINDTLHTIEKSLKDQNRKRRKLRAKLDKVQVEAPTTEIVLQLKSTVKSVCELDIKYRVKEAHWKSSYNFRAKNISDSIMWEYQAQVYNNTGVVWENVKLHLGTMSIFGNALPSIGCLDEQDVEQQEEQLEAEELEGLLACAKEGIDWEMMFVEDTSKQKNKLELLAANDSLTQKVERNANSENDLLLQWILAHDTLNKSPCMTDSTKKDTTTTAVADTVKIQKKKRIVRPGRSVEFVIPSTYTIQSDGEMYTLDVVKQKLDADFKHFCIPKLDLTVFLVVNINDWEGLNLVDGTVNIYYDDRYISQSYVTHDAVKDGLELSLGKDLDVQVKRVENKTGQRKQMFSNMTKERIAYKIEVQNNRVEPINIEIMDQIPYVTFDKIEIVKVELEEGEKNEQKGQIKWNYPLQAEESKVMNWAFTMKYKGETFPLSQENTGTNLIDTNFAGETN